MRAKRNGSFSDLTRRDGVDKVLRLTVARIRGMSPKQVHHSLVRAGIVAKDGRLRKRYGGEAP